MSYQSLEPRMLLAAFDWKSLLSNPLVSSLVSQLSSPPSFVQQPTLVGSSVVTSSSVRVSALASDDGGESRLRYFWQVQSAPAGAQVRFSHNGSNAAKNTTLTFDRAGSYVLRSQAVDRFGLSSNSSTISIQVNQAATSVAVRTATNRSVASGGFLSHTTGSLSFSSQVLDQFGRVMLTPPNVAWNISGKPAGSNPIQSSSGSAVVFNFEQAGDYILQATAGSIANQFTLRVAPLLSRLAVSQLDGNQVNSGETLSVFGKEYSVRIQGFDQFDDQMSRMPSLGWSVVSAPSGGSVTSTPGNGLVNFRFTKAGTYTVRCQSTAGTFDISLAVGQVFSDLAVSSGKTKLSEFKVTRLATEAAGFHATGLDQFGHSLAIQPGFNWSLVSKPAGSSASLTASGAAISIPFDRIGAYRIGVNSGTLNRQFDLELTPKLTSLAITTLGGESLQTGVAVTTQAASYQFNIRGFDQFGQQITKLPGLTWSALVAPRGGAITGAVSGELGTIKFTRGGNYLVSVSSSGELFRISFEVQSVLSRLEILAGGRSPLASGARVSVTTNSATFGARGLDQFGQVLAQQPAVNWSLSTKPAESAPTLSQTGNQLSIGFDAAGAYAIVANAGNVHAAVFVSIAQRQTSLQVTPGSAVLDTGATRQFSARTLDQFGRPMALQTAPAWTATGGVISATGSYTAGTVPGTFAVSAKVGRLTQTAAISIGQPAIVDGFSNADLRSLVTSYYSDGTLSRMEVIDILRSAGDGGTVTASELADLRFLIAPGSNYQMATHVRHLAGDVVHANRANATYQGQTLGNLAADSSELLLNRLIDKWFLGTDLPILTSGTLQYRPASGSLFASTPGLTDARQGMLGDCYLIASLASLAAKNPTVVQNLFIDNGDNTFTVRFYGGNYGSFFNGSGQISTGFSSGSGTADYVTVNRQLATFSNGNFAYSNYGLSSSSNSNSLWIALAEKAYAQWNQTGNAGRDGSLNFSAIEGGWMGDVNAQVLGYNSTMHYFQNSSSSTLVNAIASGNAVTLGTRGNTGIGDLVGGHAYTVTSYNSSTGKFTLHNPWGFSHPAPLTWSQLVSGCTAFVVANPNSAVAASPSTSTFRTSTRSFSEATSADSFRWISSEPSTADSVEPVSMGEAANCGSTLRKQAELEPDAGNPSNQLPATSLAEFDRDISLLDEVYELLHSTELVTSSCDLLDIGIAEWSQGIPQHH